MERERKRDDLDIEPYNTPIRPEEGEGEGEESERESGRRKGQQGTNNNVSPQPRCTYQIIPSHYNY